jgi:CRP-like cAMP-binding protein
VSGAELKSVALFEEFSEDELVALADVLEEEPVATGRALFEEGSEADGLVVVLEGVFELESRNHGSLGLLSPGTALGGLSLVAPGRREATALAAEPCSVAWLDRASFRRLIDDEPRLACKLVEALLRETAGDLREGLPTLRQSLPSADGQ